jgi:hypothetical protein
MMGNSFRMTIGDGVSINYDDGCLEISPQDLPYFGITIPVQRGDSSHEVRLAYGAEDGILYLNCGFPVLTVSVQCTAREAGTLSEELDLPLDDA